MFDDKSLTAITRDYVRIFIFTGLLIIFLMRRAITRPPEAYTIISIAPHPAAGGLYNKKIFVSSCLREVRDTRLESSKTLCLVSS